MVPLLGLAALEQQLGQPLVPQLGPRLEQELVQPQVQGLLLLEPDW
jgi:hypothetical protein